MTFAIELGTVTAASPPASMAPNAVDGSGFAQTLSSTLQAQPAAPHGVVANGAAGSATAVPASALPPGKRVATQPDDASREPAEKRKTQDGHTAGDGQSVSAAELPQPSILPQAGMVWAQPVVPAAALAEAVNGPAPEHGGSSGSALIPVADPALAATSLAAVAHAAATAPAVAAGTAGSVPGQGELVPVKGGPEPIAHASPEIVQDSAAAMHAQSGLATGAREVEVQSGAAAAHATTAGTSPLAGDAALHAQMHVTQASGGRHAPASSSSVRAPEAASSPAASGPQAIESHTGGSPGAGSGESNQGQGASSSSTTGTVAANSHGGSVTSPAASPAQLSAAAAAGGTLEIATQPALGTLAGGGGTSLTAGAAPSSEASGPDRALVLQGEAAAPTINSARVLASLGGTEMRVGMHSAEFGSISIATSVSSAGLSAQIALGHAETGELGGALGRALSAHVPEIEEKLGNALGVPARVEVRDASSGAGTAGTGSHAGSGRHPEGSGPARAVTPLAGTGYPAAPMERGEPEGQSARLSVRA